MKKFLLLIVSVLLFYLVFGKMKNSIVRAHTKRWKDSCICGIMLFT